MKLLMLITILCFFIEFSYALDCSSSNTFQESCEPFDILHEMTQIPKFNSAKHSVIAKYCLHYKIQKDSAMELLLYERTASLSLNKHKGCNSFSISKNINLKPDKIFINNSSNASGGCIKTCAGSKEACERRGDECKVNINEMVDIYDDINFFDINSCLKKMEGIGKISHLFNRYLPIKWNFEIYCDFRERIPIVGNHYIYVSEICSEEQLKMNEEYDKYREKDGKK
jgi:hypothetical protein